MKTKYDIVLNENNHRYYVNGVPKVSVTTYLKILDKPGLNTWTLKKTVAYIGGHLPDLRADDLTEEKAIEILKKAKDYAREIAQKEADVGKQIHDLIHQHLLGEKIYIKEFEERAQNGFNAAKGWIEEVKFKPLEIEMLVYHPTMDYCGRLDTVGMIGKLENTFSVIDWKSTDLYKDTGEKKPIYAEMKIQPVAYALAYANMYDYDTDKIDVWVVRLDKKTGDVDPYQLSKEEIASCGDAFCGCIMAHDAIKEVNKKRR